jgi:hypothetical protein
MSIPVVQEERCAELKHHPRVCGLLGCSQGRPSDLYHLHLHKQLGLLSPATLLSSLVAVHAGATSESMSPLDKVGARGRGQERSFLILHNVVPHVKLSCNVREDLTKSRTVIHDAPLPQLPTALVLCS